MPFGMWRRAAHSALAHGAWGAGSAFGPAARAALGEPRVAPAMIVGGARHYAKAKKTQGKRRGPVGVSAAPTNAAMKRSVDAHWKLLMDAATPEPLEPENLTEEELAAFAEKAKEYSRKMMAQHREWQRDINQKIRLKRAALAALPEGFLRDEATKEDLALFPLKRHSPMQTPPIEGFYEEKQARAEEAVSGASGRDGPSR